MKSKGIASQRKEKAVSAEVEKTVGNLELPPNHRRKQAFVKTS